MGEVLAPLRAVRAGTTRTFCDDARIGSTVDTVVRIWFGLTRLNVFAHEHHSVPAT
jgi:hypothetical protein